MPNPQTTPDDAIAEVIGALCSRFKESDFLREHEDFLQHHLDFIFCKKEGGACSHDKTRTIISLMRKHFEDGTEIVIDLNQKYTFHLPKKVLNTHEQIIEAYRALSNLYYGNPIKYLALLKRLFIEEVL